MSGPIVNVTQGKLRGVVVENVIGSSYIAFRGIPFAVPPLGPLRFKDPKPAEPWKGVRDASKSYMPCIQRSPAPPYLLHGTEDCLYLNVFTTSLTGNRPIMFWIHGGAFTSGSGSDIMTRPDYLIGKDIVLVSPNYRLGAFGFLNMQNNEAPGNQGVKDLILALKWVKENAVSFGGDPNNITIFGNSAGGALVDLLCRSPAAKGLVHKGILQSGTLSCAWSLTSNCEKRGFKLASCLGMNSNDPAEVIEFLRTVPAEKIIDTYGKLAIDETTMHKLEFGITIDSHAENPVLPVPMDQLMERDSEIPLIIGFTSHEYIMFLHDADNLPKLEALMMKRLEQTAKSENITDVDRFLKNIRNYYFDGKPLTADKLPAVVQIHSDIYFRIGIKYLIDNRIKRNCASTYVYQFSYVGNQENSTDAIVRKKRVITGASHSDEKPYLFYLTQLKTENPDAPAPGTKDRIMIERLTQLWTNFAKTGNPTPDFEEHIDVIWKPVTKDEYTLLDIGDTLKMSPIEPDIRRFK